jgi:beta-lactamase class D
MLILEQHPNYTLSGKTGLQLGLSLAGVPKLTVPVSSRLGWFVGYLEQNKNVYFFALNIESANPRDNFSTARIEITRKALRRLRLL